MRIGIIGAGAIGAALAKGLGQRGHAICLANSRGVDSLRNLASALGVVPSTPLEAVQGAVVIILAVQERRILELPPDFPQAVPSNAVIVDTGNYYPDRDGVIEEIEAGVPESLWVANHLGRPVIKAFNSIGADSLAGAGRGKGEAGRIALPVAGDPVGARQVVGTLVNDMGFDWVDAGSLGESWRQQPGAPVYCTDRDAAGVAVGLARAVRSLLPERRDEAMRRKRLLPKNSSPQDWLSLKRTIYGA